MYNSDLNLIVAIIVAFFSATATACAVNRKGRSKLWFFFTILFSPLFLIVELLPNKNKQKAPILISCPLCHKEISSEVRKCPYCGHNMPRQHSLFAIIYERIICVLWVFIIIFGILNFIPNNPLSDYQYPLPKCNSQRAKDSIEQTFESSQYRRNLGLSIVSIDHMQTVDYASDGIHCSAQVYLNNATEHTINYRFFLKNDEAYTEFEFIN